MTELEKIELELRSIMDCLMQYANPYVDEEMSQLAGSIHSTLEIIVYPYIEKKLMEENA